MKPLLTMLFVVTMACAAFGQEPAHDSPSPDVRILSYKWIDKSRVRLVQEPMPSYDPVTFPRDPGPPEVRRVNRFDFEMKLANAGSRDVRVIGWDYSSINPATQEEITSYHFFSIIKIRAHKENTLTIPFPLLPASVVLADGSRAERVVLNCIVFSDKSEWRRNSSVGSCRPPRPPGTR